ncbi:MAG: hypothetical protein Tp152DCM223801_13 [Prokaryotic dsDNA virus sp.]|nr:MAG: hypothetical protein Tp152DCM223801_13 [Prokaryotic dsDNA virus sp.]|tara:strand:+ start:9990 stop:14159 length:4170 start_codon:yes stop_codon:yes gene_type:complete
MLQLKRKFKQSKDFNFSNYIPVVHIFNNTGMKDIPTNEFGFVSKENIDSYLEEQENNGNFIGFSTVNFKTPSKNYIPNLDFISNYIENCDFIDNKHKIQSVTINFKNASKDLFRISDLGNLHSKLVRIYYVLPTFMQSNQVLSNNSEDVMYFFQGICMRYDMSTDKCDLVMEDLTTFVLQEYEIPANRVPDTEDYLSESRLEPYPMIYGYHRYAPTINYSSRGAEDYDSDTSDDDLTEKLFSLNIALESPNINITKVFHDNVLFPLTATDKVGTNTSEENHRKLGSKYGFLYLYDSNGDGTRSRDINDRESQVDFKYLRVPYTSAFFDEEQIYGYDMNLPDDTHDWPIYPNPEAETNSTISLSAAYDDSSDDAVRDFYLNSFAYGKIEVEREIPPVARSFNILGWNPNDFPVSSKSRYYDEYFNQTTLSYGPDPSFDGALDMGTKSGLFQEKLHKIVHPSFESDFTGWQLTHVIDRTNNSVQNEGDDDKGIDWWNGSRCITTARIEGVFLSSSDSRSDGRYSYSQTGDNGNYGAAQSYDDRFSSDNEDGLVLGDKDNNFFYYVNTIREGALMSAINLRDWLVMEGYISPGLDGSGDWDSSFPTEDEDEAGHQFFYRLPNLRWPSSDAFNNVILGRVHSFETIDSTQGCAINYFGIYQRILYDLNASNKFAAHILGRNYDGSGLEEYVDSFEYDDGINSAIVNPIDVLVDILYREVGIKGVLNEEKYFEVRKFYEAMPQSALINFFDDDWTADYLDRVAGNTFDTLFQARIGLDKIENVQTVLQRLSADFGFIYRFNQRNELIVDYIKEYQDNEVIQIKAKDINKISYQKTKIEDVYKDLVVKYDYDVYSDSYRKQFPRDNSIDEEYTTAEYYCEEIFGTEYDNDYYKLDDNNKKEIELKYVGDFITASLLHAKHLAFNMNQKLILKFDLPISYIYLEVGDVLSFDSLVEGIKPYGIDYTQENIINGQLMFPHFIITKTNKARNKISLEVMQVPKNFVSLLDGIFVNTLMEKYPNMFDDRFPKVSRKESTEVDFAENLTARWVDTSSAVKSVYSDEVVTFEVVSKTPYSYEVINESGEIVNYEEVATDIVDDYRYYINIKQTNVLYTPNKHQNSYSKIVITNNSGDKQALLIISRPTINEVYNQERFSRFFPSVNRNKDNYIKFIDNCLTKNINKTLNKNILDMYDLNKDGVVDAKDISEYARSLNDWQNKPIATRALFSFDRGQAFVDTDGIPSVILIAYKGKIKITKTCNDNWLFRVYKNVIVITPIGDVEIPTNLFNYVGNVKFKRFKCTNFNGELIKSGLSVAVERQLGLIVEDTSSISGKSEIIDQQVITHPHPNPTKERIKKSFVENEVNVQTNNFVGKSTHSSAQKIDRIYELNKFTRSGDRY